MSSHPSHHEVEIKLRVKDATAARALLAAHHFELCSPRAHEWNQLFDTNSASLRNEGKLLRLRRYSGQHYLTFKGPASPGKHKDREELELTLGDAGLMETVLNRLGFFGTFRYEKYRTEYRRGPEGVVTLDETPIGIFLEMEGAPEWIDSTAKELGFAESDYITASYGRLFLEYCQERQLQALHMEFRELGNDPEMTRR